MDVTAIRTTAASMRPGAASMSALASGVKTALASASPAAAAAVENPVRNSSSMFTLTYSPPDSPEYQAAYGRTLRHVSGPSRASDDSIGTIEARLKTFQKNLSLSRPDLAASGWDVTIKDGKLKVTGAMDADDRRTLETRLNSDVTLVNAVDTYTKAAVDYLESSEDNPPYTGQNAVTGGRMLYNFKNVSQQLEGKLSFKALIAKSWAAFDNPRGGPPVDPGGTRGMQSLDILATSLKATPLE